MININELRTYTNNLVNNVQQGRFRNDRFNLAVNTAQDSLFKQRLGLPEQHDPQTLMTRASSRTRRIHHDLLPFVRETVLTVPSSGRVTYPPVSDYQIFEALRYKIIVKKNTAEHASACNGGTIIESSAKYDTFLIHVKYIDQSRWAKRSQSSIVPPNKLKPVFTFTGTYFEFAPTNIAKVTLVYLKTPVRAVWAYTSPSGVDVYDAVNSVDLEWNNFLLSEIASRTADIYLGNVKDLQGQQVVREKIAVGE